MRLKLVSMAAAASADSSCTHRRWALLFTFAGLVGTTGCQSALGAGIQAFEESRFPDAVSHLRQGPAALLGEPERTRWALYWGLSELAMGNLARAIPQLRDARCRLEAQPDLLDAEERGQLASAWQTLGKMPGEALSLPCGPAI